MTSDASKAILESAEDGKTAPCVHKESGRSPANHRYGLHSCATSPSNCFKANGGAAPNSGDAAYVAGVAVGGTAAETEVGGNGLIVIEHQGTRMFAYTGSLQTFSCPNPPADTATQFTDPLYQTPVVLNTTECEGRQGCACLPGFSGVDCEFSSGVAVCGNGVREAGEECDAPLDGSGCSEQCKIVSATNCAGRTGTCSALHTQKAMSKSSYFVNVKIWGAGGSSAKGTYASGAGGGGSGGYVEVNVPCTTREITVASVPGGKDPANKAFDGSTINTGVGAAPRPRGM